MLKKFSTLTLGAINKVFSPVAVGDSRTRPIDSKLENIMHIGISKAIVHTVKSMKTADSDYENQKLVVGPLVYSQTYSGLIDVDKFLKNIEKYEREPRYNIETVEDIASMIDNETFIDAAIHYCMRCDFDLKTGNWIEQEEISHRGIEMDELGVRLLAAIHMLTTIYILLHSRSTESIYSYETYEGVYTIEWKHGEWAIGFTLQE